MLAARVAYRISFAVLVGILFAGLTTFNLCWPAPQGPADQGDFYRISSAFASGPRGFSHSVSRSDAAFKDRYTRWYHRYWTLDDQAPGNGHVSLSSAVYLPGRALAAALGRDHFDLVANAVLVIGALAVLLALVLASLRRWASRLSLAALALLLSDTKVAWYLNSFYAESGAWVGVFLLACALHLLFERESSWLLVVSIVLIAALAWTKFTVAPSALLIGTSVLTAFLLRHAWRTHAALVIVLAGALVATSAVSFQASRSQHGAEVAYNFLFSTALPALPAESRASFLAQLGLPGSLASKSGTDAYHPDTAWHDPSVRERLDNRFHLRAIWWLAIDHPSALLDIVATGIGASGSYDIDVLGGYGIAPFGEEPRHVGSVALWSSLRATWLPGAWGYAAALVVAASIVVVSIRRALPRALTWYGIVALGFLAASFAQVWIAILGNGRVDLQKHLYAANIFLDVGLVLGVAGAACALAGGQRGVRSAGQEVSAQAHGARPSRSSPLRGESRRAN